MTDATFVTSEGSFTVRLMPDHAPMTVENFVGLAKGTKPWTDPRNGSSSSGPYYDGTIFHRVIDNFMIQGGGMTADMKEKETRRPIRLESKNGLMNQRGTIAMARTSDPNSATAQFFINVKDNAFLDQPTSKDGYGYAVFGKVVQGMDVVDKIKAVPTGAGDVPQQPIVIKKATVEQ
jgi:peptidyl-prolyl cis-trans isomerase A (cyclophilin A)